MRIDRRLRTLLRRKGYRLTKEVRSGLKAFIVTVYEANPDMVEEDDDEDEDDAAADTRAQSRSITCPHCGETITIDIDLSGEDQDAVQDCSVCCSPIRITYTVRSGRMGSFASEPC